jgi:hypothetical protein
VFGRIRRNQRKAANMSRWEIARGGRCPAAAHRGGRNGIMRPSTSRGASTMDYFGIPVFLRSSFNERGGNVRAGRTDPGVWTGTQAGHRTGTVISRQIRGHHPIHSLRRPYTMKFPRTGTIRLTPWVYPIRARTCNFEVVDSDYGRVSGQIRIRADLLIEVLFMRGIVTIILRSRG